MAAKLMRHSEGQKLLLASLKRNFSPDQEAAVAEEEEEGFLSFEEVLASHVQIFLSLIQIFSGAGGARHPGWREQEAGAGPGVQGVPHPGPSHPRRGLPS